MTNYDLLKEKIIKAIPRLSDFSKGQLFTIKNMPFHYEFLHFIYNDDEEIVEIATLYNGEIDTFDYEFFTKQQITIYGKEPLLSDVLEWLKGLDTEIHSINKYGHFHDRAWNGVYSWDLSKPYLKEQNKELIDYMRTLG